MGMSVSTTSTVADTGHGPARCMAFGQFAGDGHACPPRARAGHHDQQALSLYAAEMLQDTAPGGHPASAESVALAASEHPPSASTPAGLRAAQQEVDRARVEVGLQTGYRVSSHDARACRLVLRREVATEDAAPASSPERVRAERTS